MSFNYIQLKSFSRQENVLTKLHPFKQFGGRKTYPLKLNLLNWWCQKKEVTLYASTFSFEKLEVDVDDNPQLTMEVTVKMQDKHTTANTDLVLHTLIST